MQLYLQDKGFGNALTREGNGHFSLPFHCLFSSSPSAPLLLLFTFVNDKHLHFPLLPQTVLLISPHFALLLFSSFLFFLLSSLAHQFFILISFMELINTLGGGKWLRYLQIFLPICLAAFPSTELVLSVSFEMPAR